VEEELDSLLNLGFMKSVRHADMFVKKPDGLGRLFVDYSTDLNDAHQLH
jgi:hypothetical protein